MKPALIYMAYLLLLCLSGGAIGGFALLRAYEEFKKGVAEKSRLRIWSAFFGIMFLFLVILVTLTRFLKQ
jgi:Mn2+/Fe2+ NRAMP family transporter